jgi:hypothetical protein
MYRYLWHTLNRRLCGPKSQTGRFGEVKNLLHMVEIEPQIIEQAAQPVYPLCYLGSPHSSNPNNMKNVNNYFNYEISNIIYTIIN